MNNFMKLFAIFVVLIQIQSALSQPNQLIQQLCKKTLYQALCVSTLNLDPRSKTSNLQGLGSISIDATRKKVNETLTYVISVFGDTRGREDYERYGTCIEEFGASVRRFLPAASADLKAKRYVQAVSNMKDVLLAPKVCGDQWPTEYPLELARRNKDVHDIAAMTIDIIKTFVN
ncbi:unnamed protein product [Arabis nemorensis]|uniref:Pectinesterase inhibitor domain-containing protein n=1 Tax=Arabis nemorensis TaxID=586526 RepID=A0A565B8G9_9BRAS|nr:unnamed protein product [Arabis nemorensis]